MRINFRMLVIFGAVLCLTEVISGEGLKVIVAPKLSSEAVAELHKKGRKVLEFELAEVVVGEIPLKLIENDWIIAAPNLGTVWEIQFKKPIKDPLIEEITTTTDFDGSVDRFFEKFGLYGKTVSAFLNFQGVSNIWEWDEIKQKNLKVPKGVYTHQDIWLRVADAVNCKHIKMFCSVPFQKRLTKAKDGSLKSEIYRFDEATIEVVMFKN